MWKCKKCGNTTFEEIIAGGYQVSVFDKDGHCIEVLDQEIDYEDVSCIKCCNRGRNIKYIADWVEGKYKAEIDEIKNDNGTISYQIYYYREKEDSWGLELPFSLTKEQKKYYKESFDKLGEALKFLEICEVGVEVINNWRK